MNLLFYVTKMFSKTGISLLQCLANLYHVTLFAADVVHYTSRSAREINIDVEGIVVVGNFCWVINVGTCTAFWVLAGCCARSFSC